MTTIMNYIRIGRTLFNPIYIKKINITAMEATVVIRNTETSSTGYAYGYNHKDEIYKYSYVNNREEYDQVKKITDTIK